MIYTVFQTPFGWCAILSGAQGVRRVVLPLAGRDAARAEVLRTAPQARPDRGHLSGPAAVLRSYFLGQTRAPGLPVDTGGATRFQRQVWEIVRTIPYGQVRSYAWVAARTGRPRAARAVGTAVGANPCPVLIPCHRVVRSDGSLGGFTAPAGLPMKETLLQLERAHCVPCPAASAQHGRTA